MELFAQEMFQSQFVITERCNLVCRYCYMRNRHNDMTTEVFRESFNFIENYLKNVMSSQPNERSLVAFFGGEPLLNMGLIEDNFDFLRQNPKTMPTNGILLNETILNKLLDNQVSVNISFDGDYGNLNNRISAAGKTETLSLFKTLQFNYMRKHNCKTMLYPNMFPHLKEIYLFFLKEDINFPDFTLVRDNIYTDLDIVTFDKNIRDLTEVVIDTFKSKKVSLPGLYSLYILDTLAYTRQGKRPFGCFAGTHGVGIMPNGKIYPCARFGSEGLFEIADISTGKVNYEYLNFFKRLSNPQDFPKCKQCKLYNVCNAGCSFSQLKFGGWSEMKPVDSVCELLKISYREAFKVYKALKNNDKFIDFLNHKLRRNN